MKIKVLGTGCARCMQLKQVTKDALKELGIDATVEEVKDMKRIIEYPILTTPGLVINEELVCSGHIPSKREVTQIIINALAKDDPATKT